MINSIRVKYNNSQPLTWAQSKRHYANVNIPTHAAVKMIVITILHYMEKVTRCVSGASRVSYIRNANILGKYFPGIQDTVGIEQGFDLAHPGQTLSVFGLHVLALTDTDAMFTGGGSTCVNGL